MGLLKDFMSVLFKGYPPLTQDQLDRRLQTLASQNPDKLDWRNSVVDLMKLVGLDSSLASRIELARRLGYRGLANDSASMNIWLHRTIMDNMLKNNGVPNL